MTLKQLILRLTAPWAVFSLLAGCGGVPKPHILVCIVNAPGKVRKCFQIDKDYNDDGSLKAGAVPVYRPVATVSDLNKAFTVDSVEPSATGFEDALAGLKTYLKQIQNRLANCQAGN